MIAELRKGCSCASAGRPEECQTCTAALINALGEALKPSEAEALKIRAALNQAERLGGTEWRLMREWEEAADRPTERIVMDAEMRPEAEARRICDERGSR